MCINDAERLGVDARGKKSARVERMLVWRQSVEHDAWQCGKEREASSEKRATCISEVSHLLGLHHRHHRHHLQEDARRRWSEKTMR